MLRAGGVQPLATLYVDDLAAVLALALTARIGEPRYNLWFAGKTRFAWSDRQLTVGVPNLFLQEWLQKTFGADVLACASDVIGGVATVRFVIDPQLFQQARKPDAPEPAKTTATPASAPAAPPPPTSAKPKTYTASRSADRRPSTKVRRRRLEDFVVGACNRVAHAAAVNIVEAPDDSPYPLVLHGPVGTGKSHLLEGVHTGLLHHRPDWRILFVTAEDFTNRFVQAMHHSKLGAFRKQFRDCDALLLDDLHFLAKKQATQEEFLHTLDVLTTEERPVVVTCDCHPKLADHFMPELTDRLLGGAIWGVTTPDRATRLMLLRSKVPAGAVVPEPVLAFLSSHLHGNVRELEGAVHSILHLSKVTKRKIDLDLTREALGDLLRHSVRLVRLPDIERVVCELLGVTPELLHSKKRSWMVSHPRMLAMYLARKHTTATHSEVGKFLGGRNHSTIVAGEKKVRQWLADNTSLQFGKRTIPARDVIEKLERALMK
jgi:chromosomal replication initiator protein